METTNEKWKYVVFPNVKDKMYSISNFGNIRNNYTKQLLTPWKNVSTGYLYVSLMTVNNRPVKIGMHNLVALHFVKIPKRLLVLNEKLVPNHNDFNRTNNHYKNLTWMTFAMNNEWNRIHDHWKIAEDAPNSKVTNELVHQICKMMEDGYLNKDIIKILSLENTTYYKSLLTRIRVGAEWKSISSQYNIINKNTLRKNSEEYIEDICKLISQGHSLKEMRTILNIDNNNETEKAKFKKLVWFIRTRKCYKDISQKYSW